MEKIINPVMCKVNGGMANGFAKIQFRDGNLSISGVIGPLRSGNCKGSCGQCVNEFREGEPTDGWTKEMVQEFCDIWDEWHLNDMRPYCQHQKELGWNTLSNKKVTLYNYELTREALDKKNAAKRAAVSALEKGDTFTLTEEQSKYASLPYSITTSTPISGDDAKNYEPRKQLFAGDKGATLVQPLRWLRENEHPEGILYKPCPVCGYKYGTRWLKEEVPTEIITYLFGLPDSNIKPAWV